MTKKLSLVFVLLSSSLWVLAQDVMLPAKGTFSLEVGFNPFSDKFETFKLDGAKLNGHYFISDKDALRLGLGFNYKSSFDKAKQEEHLEKYSIHSTTFAVDLGYERHWSTSKRVDLYVAVGAGYEMTRSKESLKYTFEPDVTSEAYSRDVTGGDSENPDYDKVYVGLGTGINFYLIRGLYVGAELGLDINHTNYRDIVTDNGWGHNIDRERNHKTETAIKLDVNPSLHIGWSF